MTLSIGVAKINPLGEPERGIAKIGETQEIRED